ncbi:MAG TPA: isochorismatase family protein [Bradyrhizobium sp.]|jgi:nicotinamidase-related amidase
MNTVIDLRSYVSASNSRLLVMVDLQEANYDELAKDRASDLACSIANCTLAIRHARNLGLPIAFTRPSGNPGMIERAAQSAWISGFEPKRSDMVFERPQPSCYTNRLFEDVVSRIGNFAIAGLVAEETCLATAIDAAHRGHKITFLSDASVSRGRRNTDSQAVHTLTTKAIELFAETVTTRHWLVATVPRSPKGHLYG